MITLTEKAQKALSRFIRGSEEPVSGVRFAVESGGCSGMEYKIRLTQGAEEGDTVTQSGSIQIFVDPVSAPFLNGVVVDFYEGLTENGFRFQNPNAKSSCGCGSSFQT